MEVEILEHCNRKRSCYMFLAIPEPSFWNAGCFHACEQDSVYHGPCGTAKGKSVQLMCMTVSAVRKANEWVGETDVGQRFVWRFAVNSPLECETAASTSDGPCRECILIGRPWCGQVRAWWWTALGRRSNWPARLSPGLNNGTSDLAN